MRKARLQPPSDDVAQAYLNKARTSLLSAKALLEMKHYEDAIALAYYVMYYCATAILAKIGIKSENHTATIILLEKLLNIETTSLKKAKEERIQKQYYIEHEKLTEPTLTIIQDAEQFLSIINARIETMQRNEREQARKEFLKFTQKAS